MTNKILNFSLKFLLQSLAIGICLFLWSGSSGILVRHITGESLGKQNSNDIGIDFNSFFLGVFQAPIFETFLCKWLIISQTYVSYNGKYKKQLAILLSSILFGLTHFYSIYYFLFASVAGVLLAISFCYFRERTNWFSACIYVFIIHSTSNLLIFIMKSLNI
jgi:membrane protease YdiL (CAAX protease family)